MHSSMVLGGGLRCYQGNGDRDAYLSGMFGGREQAVWVAWNRQALRTLERVQPGGEARTTEPWAAPLMAERSPAYVHDYVLEPRVENWIRVVVESETAIEWHRIAALDGMSEL